MLEGEEEVGVEVLHSPPQCSNRWLRRWLPHNLRSKTRKVHGKTHKVHGNRPRWHSKRLPVHLPEGLQEFL